MTKRTADPGMPAEEHERSIVRRLVLLVTATALAAGCTAASVLHEVPVKEPRAATLIGQLYRPAGEGPFPAVVLLHGCSGVGANVISWAEWLRSEGYAALVLDSFTGRGLGRLCADASPLTGRARSGDPYAAAASLKKLPFIDAERIGAMGFSHGGWTLMWTAQSEYAYPDVKLKALVALYTGCGDAGGSLPGSVPILMLLGAADDWTPAEPCRQLAARARDRGRVVADVTYPDARHAFDASQIRGRVYVSEARRGRGATIEYDARAHADAEKQVRLFLARYLRR